MKANKEYLKQALKLVEMAYAEITDENDPYTGGVISSKKDRRYRRIIDMLKHETKEDK